MEAKYQKMIKGDRTAFIDPAGCEKYIAAREKDFLDELARQKASR